MPSSRGNMAGYLSFCTSLTALLVILCLGNAANVRVMKIDYDLPSGNGTGVAKNCDVKVPFKFSWTPALLDPDGSVNLSVEYKVPHNFDGGYFNITIYFHGNPEPVFGYGALMDCDQVDKYLPCPIHKGMLFNIHKKINNLHALSSYPGDYDATVELWNNKKERMFCAELHVVIKEA